jgi:hypothetical protein
MYNREFTPEQITALGENEIFVFGSNLAGMHGGGAARAAHRYFGAVMGEGVGLQGNSYAIPTMQGGVETIRPYVDEFIAFAKEHPNMRFYVTKIGCGIAGFSEWDIAPLFADAIDVENILLPREFVFIIIRSSTISLRKDNYKQYLPITPIAFSYAEGGAMGSPNEVIIVDKETKTYSFHIDNFELEDIDEIVPALRKCQFISWGEPLTAAPGWNSVYLGFGNHLLVADAIYEEFAVRRAPYGDNLGKLYQEWIYIVGEILNK